MRFAGGGVVKGCGEACVGFVGSPATSPPHMHCPPQYSPCRHMPTPPVQPLPHQCTAPAAICPAPRHMYSPCRHMPPPAQSQPQVGSQGAPGCSRQSTWQHTAMVNPESCAWQHGPCPPSSPASRSSSSHSPATLRKIMRYYVIMRSHTIYMQNTQVHNCVIPWGLFKISISPYLQTSSFPSFLYSYLAF